MTATKLLATTVVGSYPQPAWLVDHTLLKAKLVPRVRAPEIWRVGANQLEEAQNDATLLAIRDQERAGIDTITDGEMRRESYSNRFATSLTGIDLEQPFIRRVRDLEIPMPRIIGPITRPGPVEVSDLEFLKQNTRRLVKITLPGPFTMSKQAADEYYHDPEAVAMAYADAVNLEARDLEAAGADVIQLDEPWLREDPDGATRYAVKAINRALAGLKATTAIHLCFGYGFIVSPAKPKAYAFLAQLADCVVDQISIEAAQPHLDLGVLLQLSAKTIVLGVVDLSTNEIESAALLAERMRRALPYVAPERLMPAPDCGMKYLTRAAAFGKLQALAEGAALVRRELS
ncbi:MAG: 5-methyltetrahydropteroyltriglutamate--homocysteine methyltransferase [Betaproteobacteria bacterium]|nr:5-methyltetrahydropteroyltriglutamate--homocysteine methyltransferase [Betaproteobacteria bacterium]